MLLGEHVSSYESDFEGFVIVICGFDLQGLMNSFDSCSIPESENLQKIR
jgi:hypothetical protein